MTREESESESDNEVVENDAEVVDDEAENASVAESDKNRRRSKRNKNKNKNSSHSSAVKMSTTDPDYHVIKRVVGNKTKEIAVFSTHCNPGRLIRNPVHGTRTNDRVGSFAERNYFRVRATTIGDGVVPVTLYYDSPEAYEKHMRTKVPNDLKSEWRARNNI